MEQTFSLSSGIVLQAKRMQIAGVNLHEGTAAVLMIKADL